MQFDVHNTSILVGALTASLTLAILFYSLARKENRLFLWAAMSVGALTVTFFLVACRGIIPDFFSIIVANMVSLLYLVAYYELFVRLLSVRPRERIIIPLLAMIYFILLIRYTYYHPSFEARMIVRNFIMGPLSALILKLLCSNPHKEQRVFYVFAAIPFALMLLFSVIRIVLYLFGPGYKAPSFSSPTFALSVIFYAGIAVWTSLSVVFIVATRLQDQIRNMALTDPLTGVFNRRALENALEREYAGAKRHGEPISLIMADLDHFKKINDTYGHQAGDAVLVHTANVFNKALRAGDVLARYGGEEFVAVLHGADVSMALSVAERLRSACKATPLVFQGRTISLTSSFGVAGCNEHADGYEDLLRKADNALYTAKEEGRDRVVSFTQGRPSGNMCEEI